MTARTRRISHIDFNVSEITKQKRKPNTMNSNTPTPVTTVDPVVRILDKLVVFGLSGDGGDGKSLTINTLSDFYQANGIDIIRIDCDSEKTMQGSFASSHDDVKKVDIRDERGADIFIDAVMGSPARIVLADLGANLERHSQSWFNAMYESMTEEGIGFLGVSTITKSPGSVVALLRQASVLGPRRLRWLVSLNEREFRHDNDPGYFGYFENDERAKNFVKIFQPSILHIKHRTSDIQSELVNRGLTLYQALYAPGKKQLGPILSQFSTKARMRGYYRLLEAQLLAMKEVLLP